MKKLRFTIFAAAAMISAFAVVSCEKFLDINPAAEVVNDDMFSTAEGCENALSGIYGALKSPSMYGELYLFGVADILAQDFSLSTQVGTQYYFGEYDYDNCEDVISTMWNTPYKIIGYANNIIANLEARTADKFKYQDWYLGEAYALRAMLHFDLVKFFATHVEKDSNAEGIPYVTAYSFEHTPFSTVGQVYDYIIADLKKAQNLLKDDTQDIVYKKEAQAEIKDQFLKYRQLHMNYYATTACLARVLRMKGDYESAKEEALKVISCPEFSLVSKDQVINVCSGFVAETESMFGIYSNSWYDDTVYPRLVTGASWLSLTPFQSALGGTYPVNYYDIYELDLGANYGADARQNWFRSPSNGTTMYLLKFTDATRLASSSSKSDRPMEGITLFRLPEMYYIVAEAYLRKNDTVNAEKYIDTVLESRGLIKLSDREPAIEPTLDLLYNERHKELFGEGQRWFDMKKRSEDIMSNFDKQNHKATDKIYVLPIPSAEYDNRNN